MAYRFKLHQPVREGARRIACEQIDRACADLNDDRLSPDEAVHQVRKRFKKLRGLIRLIRSDMGAAYGEENAWYRDHAKLLSAARDAAVLVETFDAVRHSFADQLQTDAFEDARQALVARREASAGKAQALDSQIELVLDGLGEARRRAEEWPIQDCRFKTLRKGMEKVYAQGRERFKQAYREPSSEAFHAWRKATKYHWYHIRLLEACWPALMKPRKKQLSKLADVLGDLNDLAVLRHSLLTEPEAFGSWRDAQALTALIDQRMSELAGKAWPMGVRLFAEKPASLGKRLQRYWTATRQEKRPPGSSRPIPFPGTSKDKII